MRRHIILSFVAEHIFTNRCFGFCGLCVLWHIAMAMAMIYGIGCMGDV